MNQHYEEIRKLAHQIWESEGRPEGQSDKHWKQATILVEGTSNEQTSNEATRNPDHAHLIPVNPADAPGPFEPPQPDQT